MNFFVTGWALGSASAKNDIIEMLHTKSGVELWAFYADKFRKQALNLDDADLSECDLSRIDFAGFSLQRTDFEKATLCGAFLNESKLCKSNFSKANMERMRCSDSDASEADFSGANMKGCVAERANFTAAIFDGTNLGGALFKGARLEDADLSNADVSSTMMNEATFNEKTKFPTGYQPPRYMFWTGAGDDPRGDAPAAIVADSSMTYDDLIKELWGRFEPDRIQRALGMLQEEKFSLFADTTSDTVIGVARSQSKEERVYACSLSASGVYGCCTQNLRHCGALRGMACKHVFLVLMVLCKNDAIDSAKALKWLIASLEHKPTLDKDAMTKTFLRYKGAEDGSVDWRPIETMPEDYYAL